MSEKLSDIAYRAAPWTGAGAVLIVTGLAFIGAVSLPGAWSLVAGLALIAAAAGLGLVLWRARVDASAEELDRLVTRPEFREAIREIAQGSTRHCDDDPEGKGSA